MSNASAYASSTQNIAIAIKKAPHRGAFFIIGQLVWLTVQKLATIVHARPTLSEVLNEGYGALRRNLFLGF